jgi:hypothetical protein
MVAAVALVPSLALADGHHFYTATPAELNSCVSTGWGNYGNEGYIWDADQGRIDGQCGDSHWVDVQYDVTDRYWTRHVSGCVPKDTVALFRLYNPTNGDHFYTIDAGGVNQLLREGVYVSNGIVGFVVAPSGPQSPNEGGVCDTWGGWLVPVRRAYAPQGQDHYYDMDPTSWPPNGWNSEGVAWCAPWFSTVGAMPLWQLYNPDFGSEDEGSGIGLWTVIDGLVAVAGIAVCIAGTITTDGTGAIICSVTL